MVMIESLSEIALRAARTSAATSFSAREYSKARRFEIDHRYQDDRHKNPNAFDRRYPDKWDSKNKPTEHHSVTKDAAVRDAEMHPDPRWRILAKQLAALKRQSELGRQSARRSSLESTAKRG